MRTFVVALLFLGVVSSFLVGTSAQSPVDSDALVGTWETQWIGPGRDRATCYLTFSNDFTWSGYGIALKSFGPVTIAGTWGVDSNDRTIGSFTEYRGDGDIAGTFKRIAVAHSHLRGRASTGHRHITVNGDASSTPLDVSGSNWVGEVRTGGNTIFQLYTFTASTNAPGWFDITGSGHGRSGTYTISGALVVTSNRRANGYLASDFGSVNTTSTWSFAGRFVPSLERGLFRGRDDSGNRVVIHATQ